ncbi:polyprenyl synthetase [Kitasatospora sp. NPDC051170]|uniref:polyprenyl synthetase n=1 Tax=Kitasatospora sp. NPDC051170 TaxID=3364056 RepID=UPI003798C9F3
MARENRPEEQAVLVAAGLVDVAVEALGAAVGGLRGLLGRADKRDLATDVQHDLAARGRLALDRYATLPPAHLEVLAQQVKDRRAGDR